MTEELNFHLEAAKEQMDKAINHLEQELGKLRAGKASPAMLEGITVDYYGTKSPINQVASVNTPDAKSMVIQPWEKSMLEPIEKAILKANIGVTPMNDGELIRINMPPLTEERRKELVKKVGQIAEQTKVSIRNIRRDVNEEIKKLQKNGLPEDAAKTATTNVQGLTDDYTKLVDKHVDAKSEEIMKV